MNTGQFFLSVLPTAANTWTYAYRDVEKGRLKGLGTPAPYYFPNIFLEIGYMVGGRSEQHIVAVFYSGYLSIHNAYIWTGDFPMTAYGTVYARARRLYVGIAVNVTGYTELDP